MYKAIGWLVLAAGITLYSVMTGGLFIPTNVAVVLVAVGCYMLGYANHRHNKEI